MSSMAVAGTGQVADRGGQSLAAGGSGGHVTDIPRGGTTAPHASPATTVPAETGPGHLAVTPDLALAESPAGPQPGRPRPLEVAQCSLCGIAIPLGLLVPDGGQACADIRWYCKDARSCTERWTTARLRARAHTPTVPGAAVAGAGEAAPDAAPAERPDGMLEEAKSAV
jgi:hypothetical protein